MKKLLLSCLLIGSFSFADSLTLQSWGSNSLEALKNRYQYQPFLLVFWSLECPSCYKEFEALSHWKKKHPDSHLVIVSTDANNTRDDAIGVIKEYELDDADTWIFSHEPSPKLRNDIDPNWFGELPRSYFFNRQHQAFAHSGALTPSQLEQWQIMLSKKHQP
jgi:thiol-disulfide isomerase/thioredoxin